MSAPIGILALQGDVREHERAFGALGVATRAVRWPEDLRDLGGIVLPGGESTTMSLLLESSGLAGALGAALGEGLPAFGTCAGLVLLATRIVDGRPDQVAFGVLDVTVRRNGYGRQLESFEAEVAVEGLAGGPVPAVFIRAPVVEEAGPGVDVLGRLARRPGDPATAVVCRQGAVLATAFHPELTGDLRLHRLFVELAAEARAAGAQKVTL